jgi:hypothetical protein
VLAQLRELLTVAGPGGLRQPDRRSCGPSCLVVARMLLDPAYAGVAGTRFGDEVLGLHQQVAGLVDARGALQLPWPRALGTAPWALARQLSAVDPEHSYAARLVLGRDRAFDRLVAADGLAALYVGSTWLPRHVVLAVDGAGDVLHCYEPSRGGLVDVTRASFARARLDLAGWRKPWFVVVPR